jgi:predicted GIY-YIG superfamily endonuclease
MAMNYVYILRSLGHDGRYYVGITADLRARLKKHNAGEVSHTSKYAPWVIKTYIALSDEKQAFALEKYLKSPSGRAFAKKRL